VPPDLDALLTALYVCIDDFLPQRCRRGRPARISDAEIVCLAVAQVLLDCAKERRLLRFASRRLGHLFPYIPGQSGYNKRVRALAPQIAQLITHLARLSPSSCDRLRLLDSTPVPCAQSRQTVKRSQLAGYASYRYCAAHSRHFWGFRLYLLCAPDGMPIAFELAPANAPERAVAAELLDPAAQPGQVIVADKGFAGEELEQVVASLGCQLLRPDRKDEQPRFGSLGVAPRLRVSGASRTTDHPRHLVATRQSGSHSPELRAVRLKRAQRARGALFAARNWRTLFGAPDSWIRGVSCGFGHYACSGAH
jgi:hypothetical protein